MATKCLHALRSLGRRGLPAERAVDEIGHELLDLLIDRGLVRVTMKALPTAPGPPPEPEWRYVLTAKGSQAAGLA
jgi:hypothetical protein